jgi:hypothetical protein
LRMMCLGFFNVVLNGHVVPLDLPRGGSGGLRLCGSVVRVVRWSR